MNGMDYEKAFKMLLAANYRGVYIYMQDGHWWISHGDEEYTMLDQLNKKGIRIRSKVYDGPLQALARINVAAKMVNKDGKGLVDGTYTQDWYLGDGREDSQIAEIHKETPNEME